MKFKKNQIVVARKKNGERIEVHTGSWLGNLRERGHFEDLGVGGGIILKWIIKNKFGTWVGFMWLKTR